MLSRREIDSFLQASKRGSLCGDRLALVERELRTIDEDDENLYSLIHIIGLNKQMQLEEKLADFAANHPDPDIVYISLFALMYHFSLAEKYANILSRYLDFEADDDDEFAFNAIRICSRIFREYKNKHLVKKVLGILFDEKCDPHLRADAHEAILIYLGFSRDRHEDHLPESISTFSEISELIKEKLSIEIAELEKSKITVQ